MRLSEAISYCAGIERMIAEIYQGFAERWPQPPIGALWQQMVTDEIGHAILLDDAARLPGADRDDPGLDTAKLVALREAVSERFLAPETSLDEAFAAALDLEELELDNVYRRLLALSSDDSRMSTKFRSALSQVGRHENTLLSAIEKHASDPRLLARAARDRRRMLQHGADPS
jgi:rubrerythrin